MSKLKRILVVDDEEDIVDLLRYNLTKAGFEVYTALDGKEAIKLASSVIPDVILLDVMMPELDGVEVCHIIRQNDLLKSTIIAFLTARGEDYSQIAGFDAGADDYITKPIKPRVLLSRINALLRRQTSVDTGVEEPYPIKIDRERYVVVMEGKDISLPKKEFELLALLLSKQGNVFTRENILNIVWGQDVVVGDRTIDVHIRKLREKLGEDLIKTIKGVGYKIETKL